MAWNHEQSVLRGLFGCSKNFSDCLITRQDAALHIVGVEPESSPFISQGIFRPHRMMGTAPGFVPGVLERDRIDEIALVSEEDAFRACREIARTEGILVGISSGACAVAARRIAAREEHASSLIVLIFCDTGQRYLSVDDLFDTDD